MKKEVSSLNSNNLYRIEGNFMPDDCNASFTDSTLLERTRGQDGITIEYREIVINNDNINLFRSGQLPFVGGSCRQSKLDLLVVYRYRLSETVRLNPNLAFDSAFIKRAMEKNLEHEIIAHEKRHLSNLSVGNREKEIRNFHELSVAFALDEVAAYTDEKLYNVSKTDSVAVYNALFRGFHEFIGRIEDYVTMHMDRLYCIAQIRDEDGDIELKDFEPMSNGGTAAFNKFMSKYFRFGSVDCWTEPLILQHKSKINLIKNVYLQKTADIKDFLRTGVRHR